PPPDNGLGQHDGAMIGKREKISLPIAISGPRPLPLSNQHLYKGGQCENINYQLGFYDRNTEARCSSVEFRCRLPETVPKFRCRPAGPTVFKYLIYNILLAMRGCLSGAQ